MFIFVIGAQIAALLWFIQRPAFAQLLKTVAYRYLPKDIGIVGDFSEISITLFPPGFSVKNPKITLGKRNIIKLPEGSSVVAERIDFGFRPFQIFSGDIRVNEMTIVNGDIQLFLDQEGEVKKKPTQASLTKLDFHWDELFQIRAEAIALQNVKISAKVKNSPLSFSCTAGSVRLGQWSGRGGLGYAVHLDLTQVHASVFKGWSASDSIERVQGEAFVNALGLQLESLSVYKAGVEVNVLGKLEGNVLEPKSLIADASLNIHGDLKNLIKMLPVSISSSQGPEGLFTFNGKLKGNIVKALETFQLEGLLSIKNFGFQGWKADSISAEGRWDASPSGGALVLKKALISSAEQAKLGGKQPGSGGRIEIGPVSWSLGSSTPLKFPIHVEISYPLARSSSVKKQFTLWISD